MREAPDLYPLQDPMAGKAARDTPELGLTKLLPQHTAYHIINSSYAQLPMTSTLSGMESERGGFQPSSAMSCPIT